MNLDDLPIIPHESLGADCPGLLMVRVREDCADIICDECAVLVRTVLMTDVESVLRELATKNTICSVRCSHCGALNTLPGWSLFEAFICRNCGEGSLVRTKVH